MSKRMVYTLEELRKLEEEQQSKEQSELDQKEDSQEIKAKENVVSCIKEDISLPVIKTARIEKKPPKTPESINSSPSADDARVHFRLEIERELRKYPINLQVKHLSAFLGIGKTLIYELIKNGDIPKLYIPNSRLVVVPKSKFIDWYVRNVSR